MYDDDEREFQIRQTLKDTTANYEAAKKRLNELRQGNREAADRLNEHMGKLASLPAAKVPAWAGQRICLEATCIAFNELIGPAAEKERNAGDHWQQAKLNMVRWEADHQANLA